MPPFRQQFPQTASAADPFAAYAVSAAPTAPSSTESDPFAAYAVDRKPASAEDFTTPRTWAQTLGDVAIGGLKGLGATAANIGESMVNAGLVPGQIPAAFNPDMRSPLFQKTDEATRATNTAQQVGKVAEGVAEVAQPGYELGKAGVALAREAPAVLRKAGPILAEAAKTGGAELAAHYLGGLPFGSGTAARIILKSALDSARKTAPEAVAAVSNAGGRLVAGETPTFEEALTNALAEVRKTAPPIRITTPPQPELPAGYSPRTTVPARGPVRAATSSPVGTSPQIPSRVPFDVADPATIDRLPQEADLSKPTLERVPLKDLVATQEGLSPEVVRGHLANPPADLSKVPARAVGRFDPDAVTVIRGADGRNYLSGGTHRATAAVLRGDSDIQAIVYPSKTSAIAEKVPAAVRPYFLKPLAEMAETAETTPSVAAKKVLTPADLPASWRVHTGQDLFPLQGSVEKDAIREFQQELKDQGLSVTEAIASVSKNKDLPVQLRTQLLGVLMKTRPN